MTARPAGPALLFDRQDYELVELLAEVHSAERSPKPKHLRRLFNPFLHPRGIKELAASRPRRMAYAVIRLLDSLEAGDAADRLLALRSLNDELLQGGRGSMPRNTARVLLEIMKQLVREHGRRERQVQLAHDFFAAASGRPVVVREALRRYHLLEMPEAWNQVAFDHHVHDANTKGRKAPTHLIMDAWIKGIRELTVIYYNYMTREALLELAEAAEIMGIDVRAGVEVSARFRGKYVQFIWLPQGFDSVEGLLQFIDKPQVRAFFDEGREVAKLQTAYVLELLGCFNDKHLPRLNEAFGLDLAPLPEAEFLRFVGIGQPSVSHLADYIHHECLPCIARSAEALRGRLREAGAAVRAELGAQLAALDGLMPELIIERYLSRAANPELPDPKVPMEGEGVPPLLKLSPAELLDRFYALRAGSRITLNPSNLSAADVLEVLYDGAGAVTHLEIFNLKDYKRRRNPQMEQIARIRHVLNDGSPIACKRLLLELIRGVETSDDPQREDRVRRLREILADLPRLLSFYTRTRLASRIGSDSIGRSRTLFGMGLAVKDTLPRRAQRAFAKDPGTREMIPVETEVALHATWTPRRSHIAAFDQLLRGLRRVPGLRELGYWRREGYAMLPNSTGPAERGNILTLGGHEDHPTNGIAPAPGPQGEGDGAASWRYLNSPLRNALKVLIGFVPAFLTFSLTKDWWVLAYLGAVIWFAITGLRNVVQSIVGGGGLFRSELLRWNDLVNWERVADSLLFTGFSVPLLDLLVKSLLLDRALGVTTATAPLVLYSVMAVVNGLYLFSHNTFRGLPASAAYGNFFRSVLSIPIAFGLNALLHQALVASGMDPAAADVALQKWAAVIGKAASDAVAGVIEGLADRSAAMRTRNADYKAKLAALLETHGRLEALLPERDVLALLESPKAFLREVDKKARDLETCQIINVLDLMYFWMWQPRARPMFCRHLAACTPEERQIILASQRLLERQRRISELFLDNLVGKNFSPPLAFYLAKSPHYLRDMARLAERFNGAAATR